MKPKTTLNLFKNFLANEIKNNIVLFFASTNKKVSLNLLVLLYTVTLLLSSSFLYSQSGACKAKLQVEDNGNVDSISPEGVIYKVILTNNGSSTDTYTLSLVDINSNCKNPDNSATNTNVKLDNTFLNSNKNQISDLTVSPSESVLFLVKLTIPSGTSLSKWSCNQILATSKNCSSYKVETILHTYVLNPNND